MAQKLVFDKLKTKQSELQITFDGINYESYNVASLKADGLEIPNTCDNFDNIKIKDKDDNEIDEFYYLLKDFSNKFYKDSKVKRIKISNSITSIGSGAFYNCSSLTSITISDSVTSIGNSAFSGCSSLTEITIPDSVISIEEGTFVYCSNLTSITIPEGVTSIGDRAFYGCSNLKSIIIPDSVTHLGDAFLAYANDISIKYKGTEEQWASLTAENPNWNEYLSNYSIVYNYDENDETATVHVTITVPDEP